MELPATFTVHRFMEILFVWRKLLEVGTAAINPTLGDFGNFDGVGQVISNTRDRRKVWI
jgi:hypothetical protein